MFLLRPERMERYPAEAYRRARRSLDAFAEPTSVPAAELLEATIVLTALHGLVALLIARRIERSIHRPDRTRRGLHRGAGAHAPGGASEVTAARPATLEEQDPSHSHPWTP